MSVYQQNSQLFGWGPNKITPNPEKIALLNKYALGSVLDVGCGSGLYTHHLSEAGHEVVGIDSEKTFITYCTKKYPQIKFIHQDVNKATIKEKYDTVVLFDILEHLDDHSLIKKLVKKTNRLIISVPRSNQSTLTNHALAHHHYLDRTHIRTYTTGSLKKILNAYHLKTRYLQEALPINLTNFVIDQLSEKKHFKKLLIKVLLKPFRPETQLNSTIFVVADR